MNKLILIVISLFLIWGCEEDEIFREIPTPEDQVSLERMERALELAKIYNDSVEYFTLVNTDVERAQHFDSFYHIQDSLYFHYHEAYTHLNAYDDHHHSVNPPAHGHADDRHIDEAIFEEHGEEDDHDDEAQHDDDEADHDEGEDHHEEGDAHHGEGDADHIDGDADHDEGESSEIYTHDLDSYLKMLQLREKHEAYHPE